MGNGTGDSPTIFKTDDGTEWSLQGTDLVLPGNSLGSISVVDSITAWAAGGYCEGFGIILKTTDGGITWTDMADPSYDGFTWQGINAVSPSGIWLVGGNELQGAIIHSVDGGILWTSHGESLIDSLPMISVAAFDQQNIWAVGHGFTIVKSTDGGIEWELVTPDSLQASGNDANGIILLSPTDAWVALEYSNTWRMIRRRRHMGIPDSSFRLRRLLPSPNYCN